MLLKAWIYRDVMICIYRVKQKLGLGGEVQVKPYCFDSRAMKLWNDKRPNHFLKPLLSEC